MKRAELEAECRRLRDALEEIAARVSDERLDQDAPEVRYPRAVGAVEALACRALDRSIPGIRRRGAA